MHLDIWEAFSGRVKTKDYFIVVALVGDSGRLSPQIMRQDDDSVAIVLEFATSSNHEIYSTFNSTQTL